MPQWKRLLRDEEGQDLTEYVLLLAFVALTTAALVTGPMSYVSQIWSGKNAELSQAVVTATS